MPSGCSLRFGCHRRWLLRRLNSFIDLVLQVRWGCTAGTARPAATCHFSVAVGFFAPSIRFRWMQVTVVEFGAS